jgi:hypothetical protein
VADRDSKPDFALGEKLEELDSLLQDNSPDNSLIGDRVQDDNIPILDEPVTTADFDDNIPVLDEIVHSRDRFADLTDRLEQKFMQELDQLVQLLKGNLKHSIMKEIRKELSRQDSNRNEPEKNR